MAVKKPSQAATKKPDSAAVEALANQLADRPYTSNAAQELAKQALERQGLKSPAPVKAKPISISLPPHIIAELEDQVMDNKRSGEGPRTVSGLIKLALRHYGYKL